MAFDRLRSGPGAESEPQQDDGGVPVLRREAGSVGDLLNRPRSPEFKVSSALFPLSLQRARIPRRKTDCMNTQDAKRVLEAALVCATAAIGDARHEGAIR